VSGVSDTLPAVAQVLGSRVDHAQSLRLDHGLTAISIKRPGLALNVSAHRRIYRALVPVTTSSFGADMTPYWAQRSKEGYLERLAEFVLIADAEGSFVGWTGYHLLPHEEETIVYLDSTGMVPAWQSKGVMRQLMTRLVIESALPACAPGLPVYLTARSESPIFYRLMRALVEADRLFPNAALAVPPDVSDCALHLADWLGQREILDPTTLVLRNAYAGTLDELYGELPSTGDAQLDKLFRGELGALDAYLIIGRLR
jgi:GNAT superfamily N-acetyltransferase